MQGIVPVSPIVMHVLEGANRSGTAGLVGSVRHRRGNIASAIMLAVVVAAFPGCRKSASDVAPPPESSAPDPEEIAAGCRRVQALWKANPLYRADEFLMTRDFCFEMIRAWRKGVEEEPEAFANDGPLSARRVPGPSKPVPCSITEPLVQSCPSFLQSAQKQEVACLMAAGHWDVASRCFRRLWLPVP